jgi:hypothetical protein
MFTARTMSRCAPSRISAASSFHRTVPTSRSHWSRPVELLWMRYRATDQPAELTGTSRERKPGRERLARRSTVNGFPTSHRPLPGWQPSYYCLRDIYSWKNRTFLHRPVYAGDEDLLYRGKPAAVETAVKAVIGASESPGRCRVVAISARCPPFRGVSLPSRSTCVPRVSFVFHTIPIPFYGQAS